MASGASEVSKGGVLGLPQEFITLRPRPGSEGLEDLDHVEGGRSGRVLG